MKASPPGKKAIISLELALTGGREIHLLMCNNFFFFVKLMTSDNKNRATTKRAGKKKQTRKAALLTDIPPANIKERGSAPKASIEEA